MLLYLLAFVGGLLTIMGTTRTRAWTQRSNVFLPNLSLHPIDLPQDTPVVVIEVCF
jgi:hypothetical protein